MITLMASLLVMAAGPATAPAATAETRCSVLYSDAKGKIREKPMASLHVAGADPKDFRVSPIAEGKVDALICWRNSLVPDASDWLVVHAGYPLFITDGKREIILELHYGQLQVRAASGQLTAAERPLVDARVKELQSHLGKGG